MKLSELKRRIEIFVRWHIIEEKKKKMNNVGCVFFLFIFFFVFSFLFNMNMGRNVYKV